MRTPLRGGPYWKAEGKRVKYDRPVWQLMHACADALPETFSFDDVRAWFSQNYPEVGVATIRAHVVGLTESGTKHPQFQRRSPLFRRVSRGVYAPIPLAERGELPEDDPVDEAAAPARFAPVETPDGEPAAAADQSDARPNMSGTMPMGRVTGPDDIGVEGFWTFLAEQDARDDAMAHAAAARRKDEEKEERRRRKAAKREAKRRAERDLEQERLDRLASEEIDEAPASEIQPGLAEIDAERRRLSAEREEMARIAVERAELTRAAQQEIEAERARLQAERAEADRMVAVRREAERAAAAQAEAARHQAERLEAERLTHEERKRASKLRKAARKEREAAETLERERMERRARRKAERRARETAEQHLRDAAERRRRDEDERHRAAISVREELARLEQEALARIETERAMRARSEVERAERDRMAFDRAEKERLAFEQDEMSEREQLEREEQQLHMTLRPMLDTPDSAPPAPEPPDPEPPTPESSAAEPKDRDDPPFDPSGVDDPDDPRTGPGGIVIVRAPRPASAPEPAPDAMSVSDVETPASDVEPDLDEGAGRPHDAIVLGSVGERLRVPAPAQDAFRDLAFQQARRHAESSGSRWFVLSADHGLLEPQEWMSPDERDMTDIEPRQRAAWAAWVVARLDSLVGDLTGQVVQVEAPGEIGDLVVSALREAGADVVTGSIAPAAPAVTSEIEDDPVPDEPDAGDDDAETDQHVLADDPEDEPVTEDDGLDEDDDDDEDERRSGREDHPVHARRVDSGVSVRSARSRPGRLGWFAAAPPRPVRVVRRRCGSAPAEPCPASTGRFRCHLCRAGGWQHGAFGVRLQPERPHHPRAAARSHPRINVPHDAGDHAGQSAGPAHHRGSAPDPVDARASLDLGVAHRGRRESARSEGLGRR